MTTINFAPERLADCIEEVRSLASAHYSEAGRYSPAYDQSVDWEAYLELDKHGVLLSMIARADGILVGYWGGIQHCDLHSSFEGKRLLALSQAVFYVVPSYRHVVKRFCRAIERIALEKGCAWIAFGAWNERTDAFFAKLGYIRGEMIRVKVF